jgi:hypothetical protein
MNGTLKIIGEIKAIMIMGGIQQFGLRTSKFSVKEKKLKKLRK